jgi:hypothetical protein
MTRRLLDLLALASLLLCVAAAALWVRSYWVSDWVGRVCYTPGIDSEDHHVYLRTDSGTASLVGGGDPAENFHNVRWVWQRSGAGDGALGRDGPPWLRAIGIGWDNEQRLGTGETTWGAQVRLAWPVSLFGLTAVLLGLRRRPPRRNGLCPRCGYDLTGNVSGTCPECGLKGK